MKKLFSIFTAMTLVVLLAVPPRAQAVLAGLGGTQVGVGIAIAIGGVATAAAGIYVLNTVDYTDGIFTRVAKGIFGAALVLTGIVLEKDKNTAVNTFSMSEDLAHKVALGIYTSDEAKSINDELQSIIEARKANPLLISLEGLENIGQIKRAVQEKTHLSDLSTSYLVSALSGNQI